MMTDRRRFLKISCSFALVAPAAAALSACNTLSLDQERQKVALLLPLSGRASSVGQNMQQAAKLALAKNDPFVDLIVLDTASEETGASAAAAKAVRAGAQIVLGPLFRDNTQAALKAVDGRVPLVAFTNDVSLAGQGAFVFGLTPEQSVAAILGYAKGKGLDRIAVVTQPGEGSRLAAAAAQRLGGQNGVTITAVVPGGQGSLAATVRRESGGRYPDAILLPGGGEAMIRDAEALGGSKAKLLGTEQWLGNDLASRKAFDKAWFAAPVPSDAFSKTFAAQQSATAGILAGLAYDAVNMARTLAAAGDLSEKGVARSAGFNGALGHFRFRPDHTCERSLSILAVEGGGERVIASSQQT